MSSATLDETLKNADPYYSRLGDRWEPADRADPVIWGNGEGPLPQQQVDEFREKGFLFLPSLFSQDEIKFLLEEARHQVENWPEGQSGIVREPGSKVVRSIFRLHQISSVYARIFRDSRLLAPARQILGSDVYIHQSRVNYKPALDGKEFFWHSDFETWHVEDGMPRMRAISASVFLTESHEFNGPLMLIPGSHKTYIRCAGFTPEKHYEQSLRRQEYGVPSREALEHLLQNSQIVAPKGAAGSVVLFDCNTMHASSGNLSINPRVNLFAVYNSMENRLVEPFCDQPPRPEHLAERTFKPLVP